MATKSVGSAHGHMWLVGVLGMAAGLALMLYVPSLKAVSDVVVLFAGFHLVGGFVLLASAYMALGRRYFRRQAPAGQASLDFGWAPAWLLGPQIAALVALAAAVAVQVAAPAWWPLSLLLALLAASFFAGHLFAAAAARPDHAALPMVRLLAGDSDLVLDGGCGAGRTTIALSRVLKAGQIVALDRFDSDYIEGGGRSLLERNLRLAGIAERVRIEQGDLTRLPFADRTFDSAVSAHAMDHLGPGTETGLREMRRVLKPGGRFLLMVWVPGWAMFAVANVMAAFLTSKGGWRTLARRSGFEIVEQGSYSGLWFLLLQKPAAEDAGSAQLGGAVP